MTELLQYPSLCLSVRLDDVNQTRVERYIAEWIALLDAERAAHAATKAVCSEVGDQLLDMARMVNEAAELEAESQNARRKMDEAGARDWMRLTDERDAARRQNDELAAQLAEAREAHGEAVEALATIGGINGYADGETFPRAMRVDNPYRATVAEVGELRDKWVEAREGYMMLPEDLEVQRLRAEVARLRAESGQAQADAVAFADECAGIEDQDSPCGVPIYDRIAEYREAMKRETPPSR